MDLLQNLTQRRHDGLCEKSVVTHIHTRNHTHILEFIYPEYPAYRSYKLRPALIPCEKSQETTRSSVIRQIPNFSFSPPKETKTETHTETDTKPATEEKSVSILSMSAPFSCNGLQLHSSELIPNNQLAVKKVLDLQTQNGDAISQERLRGIVVVS